LLKDKDGKTVGKLQTYTKKNEAGKYEFHGNCWVGARGDWKAVDYNDQEFQCVLGIQKSGNEKLDVCVHSGVFKSDVNKLDVNQPKDNYIAKFNYDADKLWQGETDADQSCVTSSTQSMTNKEGNTIVPQFHWFKALDSGDSVGDLKLELGEKVTIYAALKAKDVWFRAVALTVTIADPNDSGSFMKYASGITTLATAGMMYLA
jgi:hypothetical protein